MTAALGAAQGETAATAEDKLTCYTADVAVKFNYMAVHQTCENEI